MKQQCNLLENCFSFFADPLLPFRQYGFSSTNKQEKYKPNLTKQFFVCIILAFAAVNYNKISLKIFED